MRFDNSVAAFFVKVSPRICSGLAKPFATSHKARTASNSVFPLPAPATTNVGESKEACSTASIFSWESSLPFTTLKISAAEYLADIGHRLGQVQFT